MTNSDIIQRAFEAQLIRARAHLGKPPTITSVAAAAGISRSSLYRFHPTIAARIRALSPNRNDARDRQLELKVKLLTEQLRRERETSSALARACSELAAEKAAIREQLEDEKLSLQLRLAKLEGEMQGKHHITPLKR